jgi:hypothetical protein
MEKAIAMCLAIACSDEQAYSFSSVSRSTLE